MAWTINPQTSIHEVSYIAFDLETTGFSAQTDQIIEIGAVRFNTEEIINEFSSLIKPTVSIANDHIHGITDHMVKDSPSLASVLDEFIKFIDETQSVIVAHNMKFDFSFLNNGLQQCNKSILQSIPLVDTLRLAKKSTETYTNHQLQTLAQHYDIEVHSAHRALDDAHVCRQVFLKLMSEISIMGDLEISKVLL